MASSMKEAMEKAGLLNGKAYQKYLEEKAAEVRRLAEVKACYEEHPEAVPPKPKATPKKKTGAETD